MIRASAASIVCVLCAGLLTAAANAQTWQSLDGIRAAAVERVRGELAADGTRRSVEADALDERLHLVACDAPLETFMPAGGRRGANSSVGVRCASPQPWKIYVSVHVTSRDRVLVAARPLSRDAVLGAADLELVERNVDLLAQGYLTDVGQLSGMRLRRPVATGSVLTPAMLASVPLIARGQQVTLEAGADAMSIRMAGESLDEAALGQRIRVRNLSSARVVEGIVRSAQVVEVLLR
jgi:flagella basal body P-ring formation protein FlgA